MSCEVGDDHNLPDWFVRGEGDPVRTPPEEWHRRFLRIAAEAAQWSKDLTPRRRVGALLVSHDRRAMSPGYSGFPKRIVDTIERLEDQDLKRLLTVHAEENAVRNASFETKGSTLYVTRFPCHVCAKTILGAEVATVVAPFNLPSWSHEDWGPSVRMAAALFREAGLAILNARDYGA
jgi:dCMP deaminase